MPPQVLVSHSGFSETFPDKWASRSLFPEIGAGILEPNGTERTVLRIGGLNLNILNPKK